MALFFTGLGIALSFLLIQWYMEKKADEEEMREHAHQHKMHTHTAKR